MISSLLDKAESRRLVSGWVGTGEPFDGRSAGMLFVLLEKTLEDEIPVFGSVLFGMAATDEADLNGIKSVMDF